MRNVIKIYLLAFMAILCTGSLFGQKPNRDIDPEARATKMAERMTTSLKLSDAQASKVKAIFIKHGERRHAMRSQKQEGDREKMRSAMQKMESDFEKEIQAVLTIDQFNEFQTMPRPMHRRGKGHKGKKRGKEHKAFHKEKIEPIMLEQRAKLESKISKEDKATIAQLRVDLKKERTDRKGQKDHSKKRMTKEEREKRKAERESNPNHIKLVELTEKYSADIEPLLAEVKEEMKSLKKEMRKEKGERGERTHKGKRHKKDGKTCEDCDGKKHKEGKGHDRKAHHKNKKQSRFLLLDPNQKAEQANNISKTSAITNVRVYPNPSQGISQIEYQLEVPGKVLIELRDKEGTLIDTIENTKQSAGAHKTSVNFGKYTVGIYYIILTDQNGNKISEKVIR